MASRFILRPIMKVPEQTLTALEHLCMVQSEQLWVSGNELESRLRDTRKWYRLHLVEEVSEICDTFLNDPHFALLGKYLTKTLTVLQVSDFLRLFMGYLSPFNLSLPSPLEHPLNNSLISGMEERNLRMFAEAFATIYGHYSIQTVTRCVKLDIEGYLRGAAYLPQAIVFPFLGSITFDFSARVLRYLPGPTLDGIWPDYAPLRTICVNL